MASNPTVQSPMELIIPPSVETSIPVPAAPYRGLDSFRYVDSPIFCAREKEVRKLLRYITMYRAVLLYGDSGSGKSSLINAGLMPKVLGEGFVPDRIRVQPRAGEEFIIERMPQASNGSVRFLPSNFIDEDLQAATRIVVPAKSLKEKVEALPSGKTPVLIFDQFEELVTLFEESPPNKELEKALEVQAGILESLVELIGSHHLKVKLLFVFREDYLAKLTKFFVKCPDLIDHYQRLTPPPKEVLKSIIRGPFEKLPGKFGKEISDELASDLSQQIGEGTESIGVNLSEVQIVCLKLWRSDDPETLLAKRKIQGLLEDFLSESLNTLPSDLYAPALALLRKLVTSSGTRNVISEDDLILLVQKEEKFSTERLLKALGALVTETKLVRRERRQDTVIYQLVSEFLIPWIKQQQQLQQARLVRRRAIRWIGLSLLAAIIMALVSLYVWRFRTEQALRDAKVVELTDKLNASEESRAELAKSKAEETNKYLGLLASIESGNRDQVITQLSGDLKKATIDSSEKDAQIAMLLADHGALTVDNRSLKEKVQSLTTEIQNLRTTANNYQVIVRDLEESRKEVTNLKTELTTRTEERDRLLRENQLLKKTPVSAGGGGPGPVVVDASEPVVVFQTPVVFQEKTVALTGDEFKGLLTLKFGKAFGKKQPVYILETHGGRKIESERYSPSKKPFTMDFEYKGKSYYLEARVAGDMSPALRDIKVVRLPQ